MKIEKSYDIPYGMSKSWEVASLEKAEGNWYLEFKGKQHPSLSSIVDIVIYVYAAVDTWRKDKELGEEWRKEEIDSISIYIDGKTIPTSAGDDRLKVYEKLGKVITL